MKSSDSRLPIHRRNRGYKTIYFMMIVKRIGEWKSMSMLTTVSPAEVYDQYFVPALFQYWGEYIASRVNIREYDHVLDVACGTGVLACAAEKYAGSNGNITGLDPNEAMLNVARSKSTSIIWQQGKAESLPFANDSFDRVISQFGFMFFENQRMALIEMMRVLKPGGQLMIAVCDAIDRSPGYAVLAELLQRLFGVTVAEAFRAPFASGDRKKLLKLCMDAGIKNAQVVRHDGPVRFSSIQSMVTTERACVWTLGGLLDDAQFELLSHEAKESLEPFCTQESEVEFNMPVLLIDAKKVK